MALPWFKRQGEELPEELKGMEAADLVAAINASKEVQGLKDQLTELQGKSDEAETLRQQIANLEQRIPQQREERREAPKGPTSFLDDENAAFNERMAPYAMMMLSNQSESAKFIARQSLKGVDAQIWDKYSTEIEQVMTTVDPHYKAMPQTWMNALDNIAGKHRNDILKMASEKSEFFSESAGGVGGGGGPRPDEVEPTMTTEQKKIAKGFGVKDADYLKAMKEMTVRG